jgi:hypothetical protein
MELFKKGDKITRGSIIEIFTGYHVCERKDTASPGNWCYECPGFIETNMNAFKEGRCGWSDGVCKYTKVKSKNELYELSV